MFVVLGGDDGEDDDDDLDVDVMIRLRANSLFKDVIAVMVLYILVCSFLFRCFSVVFR